MYAFAAFLFSLSGIVAKSVMQSGMEPVELAPIRALFAAVMLAFWVAATNPSAFRVTRTEAPTLALYGMGVFLMTQLMYMTAINNLPVAIGTLLSFLAIVNVAVWNWLRHGRRINMQTAAAILISLLGGLFITGLVTGDEFAVGIEKVEPRIEAACSLDQDFKPIVGWDRQPEQVDIIDPSDGPLHRSFPIDRVEQGSRILEGEA